MLRFDIYKGLFAFNPILTLPYLLIYVIRFKAILSRFKPFCYLCRVIAHTTKDKANCWFSVSYEYSSNVNYFNYKLSCYCLLISCFHSNKIVLYACVCVYVCVRMCVCTLALVCAYPCVPVRLCVSCAYAFHIKKKYRLHTLPYFVQFFICSLKILHK